MKVVILGVPTDSGNRGVLALGAALSGLMLKTSPGCDVIILGGQHRLVPLKIRVNESVVTIPVIHFRLSPRAPLCDQFWWIFLLSVAYRILPSATLRSKITQAVPCIRALAECDMVGDVRGGDSFSDIYGMERYIFGCATAVIALLVAGKLVQFPQTYGPYKSGVARGMARFLLRRSSTILARDTESQLVARSLVRVDKHVELSPDVAFALEPARVADIEFAPASVSGRNDAVIVGINVNGLMFNGGYDRANMFGLQLDYPEFLRGLITRLLEDPEVKVWLVPHTYAAPGDVESDNDACRLLRESLPGGPQARTQVIVGEYDQHEIKGVIGVCDFFVGSRMHSCIAALSQGIPCVGVAYSMKFKGVFESVGMEDWVVDGRSVATDTAIDKVMTLYSDRNRIREPLAKRSQDAREKLRTIFGNLLGTAPETMADGKMGQPAESR